MSQINFNSHALLTSEQMRLAEAAACSLRGVTLRDLMQNAGEAVAKTIMKRRESRRVLVMCGPGNNGGDGYVAARVLRDAGWPVVVGQLSVETLPPEAAQAAEAWQGTTQPLALGLLDEADLVVDALFGLGLQRDIEGSAAAVIDILNKSALPVVAVDMPSGIDSDTGRARGVAVKAVATVTFFRKKIGHILLPGAEHCGEVVVADIGIPDASLDAVSVDAAENHSDVWWSTFPLHQAGGHKYTRGHALVFGGPVMTGASRLAARAAQRLGAGLVTLAAPVNAAPLYAAALESVIVRPADNLEEWRSLVDDPKKNVILIGPGAGVNPTVRSFALDALASKKPCVLDADALTVFADEPSLLFEALHDACVLTPHEGEFVRLFGKHVDLGTGKLNRTRQAASLAGCTVLLKGADTVIAHPDGRVIVNHNAPPWLATAGSGDVLGGMILGLLAPGMPPFEAAAAAAWFHGRIASDFGPGLIAEDLVAGIPSLLKDLSNIV